MCKHDTFWQTCGARTVWKLKEGIYNERQIMKMHLLEQLCVQLVEMVVPLSQGGTEEN